MKTSEVAQVLGTTPNVVTENGKKLFPNKEVQRGKAVDWTEEEVTVLIDHMRKNPSNNAGNELISSTYKSELSVLENEVTLMGKTFNVYGTVEEPLFRAKDVADWIEHSNLTVMVNSVDEDEKVVSHTKDSLGRENSATFLTENGVYEVLMLSRKPVAREFKKEVKKMLHALRTKKAALMPTNFADALEAYAKEVRAREEAQQTLFAETQQKLLALEQKEAAENETERIYQCNRNFHNNLLSASQIGEKLGITANMVGRIANEHNLKQDPIYGKLGKVQLNNGKWVNQFYYNDDALTLIKHFAFN